MMLTKRNVGMCFLTLLFLVVILPGGFCAWFWIGYISPYQKFRIKESEVVPLFDALNDATAQTLPPLPVGAIEEKRWSVGITNPIYDHGRWLYIYVTTNMGAEEVSTYYRENLLVTGWNEYTKTHTPGIDFYFRDTSCLEVLLPGQLSHYLISIWNDFQGQPFSPSLPDLNYMQFAEVGETRFATCPP